MIWAFLCLLLFPPQVGQGIVAQRTYFTSFGLKNNDISFSNRMKGVALVSCVNWGMSKEQISRMFGEPLMVLSHGSGTAENYHTFTHYWFTQYGVEVMYHSRISIDDVSNHPTPTPMTPNRVHGGIGP